MEKCIAIVVTYNRLHLLKECIEALRNQTRKPDGILVVNNGGHDATSEWLDTQKDLLSISQKNIGSGGGFNTGIQWAYKNSYSWIWCMDDDGYPRADALEKLLEPETAHLCLRNCAVINKEDRRSFVWKTKNYRSIDEVQEKIIPGVGHPFNGTMLHRNIVERVGMPKEKLFVWGDESEYYYRITRRDQIPVITVADSIHYHPAAAYSFRKDWDLRTDWKMYYYVRNRFEIDKSKFSIPALALAHYCLFLLALAGLILFYQRTERLKKVAFMLWPAYDAFTNKFDATPQAVQLRLTNNSTLSLGAAWRNYASDIYTGFASLFVAPRLKPPQHA
jgi:GT2 family glycosyltransferase